MPLSELRPAVPHQAREGGQVLCLAGRGRAGRGMGINTDEVTHAGRNNTSAEADSPANAESTTDSQRTKRCGSASWQASSWPLERSRSSDPAQQPQLQLHGACPASGRLSSAHAPEVV